MLLLLCGALAVGGYFLLHMTVLKLPRCQSAAKLHGKTAVVTGANTGIGKTTAMDLARRGAKVILACRDRRRAEAAVQEIIQETGNQQVIFMQLDLASLQSVRSFADNFLKSESRLDLLINNAGANTGIGKTTAMDLARRGAKVILACRDRRRAEAAVQEIIQETGNQQVIFMQLDLASLQSVRSFADNFLKSEPRLDLLINNAGLISEGKTEDGFGMIFGVNHLGPFLLTVLLLDRLKASGPSRVVNVASQAYESGKVDFNYLTTHKELGLGNSNMQLLAKYCHSKLCNVLFTYELAKRLQGSDVTCYSLHPGFIRTEIARYYSLWFQLLFAPLVWLLAADADSGAQTSLHCALEPDIEHLSGHYFTQCSPLTTIDPKARDDATSRKLWELSETFCGLS